MWGVVCNLYTVHVCAHKTRSRVIHCIKFQKTNPKVGEGGKGEGVAIMSIFYSAALGSGTWYQRLNSQKIHNPKKRLTYGFSKDFSNLGLPIDFFPKILVSRLRMAIL